MRENENGGRVRRKEGEEQKGKGGEGKKGEGGKKAKTHRPPYPEKS